MARQVVVDRDGLVDGVQLVEAVVAEPAHAQVQVDLGGRAGAQGRGDHRCTSSAIRTNAAMPSDSPRASGSTPAATSAASAAAADPAIPLSTPRSALRRWANAASTTAKTCSRVTVRGRRLVMGPGDQAGVDVGRRPEHVAADRAGPADVGVPRRLHRRDAVHLRARRGGEPVGHLRLHHHQPVLQRGQHGEQVQQHRHGHVVGQVRHQRGRRRTRQLGRRAARPPARPRTGRPGAGAYSAIVSGSSPASFSSTSTATTRAATSSRARVSEPSPGPDLEHHVVGRDAGLADDPAHGVGIDDEVLPALLGRAQVHDRGQ